MKKLKIFLLCATALACLLTAGCDKKNENEITTEVEKPKDVLDRTKLHLNDVLKAMMHGSSTSRRYRFANSVRDSGLADQYPLVKAILNILESDGSNSSGPALVTDPSIVDQMINGEIFKELFNEKNRITGDDGRSVYPVKSDFCSVISKQSPKSKRIEILNRCNNLLENLDFYLTSTLSGKEDLHLSLSYAKKGQEKQEVFALNLATGNISSSLDLQTVLALALDLQSVFKIEEISKIADAIEKLSGKVRLSVNYKTDTLPNACDGKGPICVLINVDDAVEFKTSKNPILNLKFQAAQNGKPTLFSVTRNDGVIEMQFNGSVLDATVETYALHLDSISGSVEIPTIANSKGELLIVKNLSFGETNSVKQGDDIAALLKLVVKNGANGESLALYENKGEFSFDLWPLSLDVGLSTTIKAKKGVPDNQRDPNLRFIGDIRLDINAPDGASRIRISKNPLDSSLATGTSIKANMPNEIRNMLLGVPRPIASAIQMFGFVEFVQTAQETATFWFDKGSLSARVSCHRTDAENNKVDFSLDVPQGYCMSMK